ncbi:MAG TPA: membrane protein insertion efficiency factor YidD [Acetobacteraceae bacterium]|nr:membrane protein insertion efficiency factor YidD [Acetobacteraceae bacterium]
MEADRGARRVQGPPVGLVVGSAIRALIRAYQLLIAPLFPPACRYYPTCSHYAAEAVALHGPWRGSLLAGRRLLRCHPWGGSGYDPVPSNPRG